MWIYRIRPVYILPMYICLSILLFQLIPTSSTTIMINDYNDENRVGQFIEVYFMPVDAEKAINRIVELISNAESYVYVAVYILDEERIISALIDAAHRGLDVRVVSDTDGSSQSVLNRLRDNGIGVVVDERVGDYMHDKFIVIDDRIVVTGSTNFRDRSFYKNNNDLVVIHSVEAALNYKAEFLEMYHRIFGGGKPTSKPLVKVDGVIIKTYFSPDDGVADKLIELLSKANRSIFFATYVFTNMEIARLLASKARNITVAGVFEEYTVEKMKSVKYVYDYLRSNGVHVYSDVNPYTMHCKLFIIDNRIVVTGSYNPTYHAEYSNDENIVVIYSYTIASRYLWYHRNYLLPNGTRLIVHVVDPDGNPLSGVRVYAEDLTTHTRTTTLTNGSGIAVIYMTDLRPEHMVKITVSPNTLLSTSKSITVKIGLGPNNITITVEKYNSRLIVFIIGLIIVVIIAFTYPYIKKFLSFNRVKGFS